MRTSAALVLFIPLLACASYRAPGPPACTDCRIQVRNAETYALEIWTAYDDGRNAQYHSSLYPGEVKVLASHPGGRIEVRSKNDADARGGCYPIEGPAGSDDDEKLVRLECRIRR